MEAPLATGTELPPGGLSALFRRPVYALDRLLRRLNHVFEYSSHPQCIIRAQAMTADRAVTLSDGTALAPGERFLELHLWSEHVPRIGRGGASLVWARRMRAQFELSLRELARWLPGAPQFADIRVLRANLNFTTSGDTRQTRLVIVRFGFEEIPDDRPLTFGKRLHRLGENILLAMLILASNPRTFRWDVFRRGRVLTYISREALLRRYGDARGPA
jgi:hypothetical protein